MRSPCYLCGCLPDLYKKAHEITLLFACVFHPDMLYVPYEKNVCDQFLADVLAYVMEARCCLYACLSVFVYLALCIPHRC
jgi:hypothetical protein